MTSYQTIASRLSILHSMKFYPCNFATSTVGQNYFQNFVSSKIPTIFSEPSKWNVEIFGIIWKLHFGTEYFRIFGLGSSTMYDFRNSSSKPMSEICLWIFRLLVPKAQFFNMKLLTLFRAFSKIAQRDFLFISVLGTSYFRLHFFENLKFQPFCPEIPKWNIVIFGIFWKFPFET